MKSGIELKELNAVMRRAVEEDRPETMREALDYAVTKLGLDELNAEYFLALYRKWRRPQREARLAIHDPSRGDLAQVHHGPHRTVYPTEIAPNRFLGALYKVNYEDLVRESNAKAESNGRDSNAMGAHDVAFWVKKMQAGSGSSMTRNTYLSRIRGEPASRVRIGAKGTDLFVTVPASEGSADVDSAVDRRRIPLAEVQLLQSILEHERGELGEIIFHDIVSSETEESIRALWAKRALPDPSVTYDQYVSTHKGLRRFTATHQQWLPTLDEQGQLTCARLAPGGHALFAVEALRAAWRPELRPHAPGLKLIAAISNGEDLSSAPDRYMLSYMASRRVPIALVTTEKTRVDAKGGVLSLLEDPAEEGGGISLTVLETAQAKEAGQQKLFESLGGMINTNLALFNYDVLVPLLTREVEAVGENEVLRIIAPDLISNVKEQEDQDGVRRKYLQLEGAMGSTLMNLDRHWRRRHGQPLVHVIHVARERRTQFFSPIKSAFDFFLQFHSDRFELDPVTLRLRDRRPGMLPVVSLSDPVTGGRHYQDVQTVLEAFEGASVRELDELRIEGQVRLPNAVLRGRLRITNRTGKVADLSRLLAPPVGVWPPPRLELQDQDVLVSDDPVRGLRCTCTSFDLRQAIA